jgi:protein involved in polysaccharide export with SLBB domain
MVGTTRPTTAPAATGAVYRLQVTDLVQVAIEGLVQAGFEQVKVSRVGVDGLISLPMLGSIPAAGFTEAELEQAIVSAYRARKIADNVQVKVFVVESHPAAQVSRSQPVYAQVDLSKVFSGAEPVAQATPPAQLKQVIVTQPGESPTSLPAGTQAAYQIKTNDLMIVSLENSPDAFDDSKVVRVRPDGTIQLPVVPPIQAADLTIPELAGAIMSAYRANNVRVNGDVVVTIIETSDRRPRQEIIAPTFERWRPPSGTSTDVFIPMRGGGTTAPSTAPNR